MLMPIVTEKRANLFKADSQAGVLISIDLYSQDTSNKVQSVKIPQLYIVDVKEYGPGQLMLPLEKSVLMLPSLRPQKTRITRADLDITVIRRQSDTPFTHVLQELAKLTKSGFLAQNPYADGASVVSDLFLNLLDPKEDTDHKVDRPITGSVSIALDPGRTGVYGIVLTSKSQSQPGVVNISSYNDYEFRYERKPVAGLMVKRKGTNEGFVPLLNTHVMMTVDAIPRGRTDLKRIVPVDRHASTHSPQDFEGYVKLGQGDELPLPLKNFYGKLDTFEQMTHEKLLQKCGAVGKVGQDTSWETSEENLFLTDLIQVNLRRSFLGVTNAPITIWGLFARQQDTDYLDDFLITRHLVRNRSSPKQDQQ
jgi:hypothetical protein